MKKVAQRCRWRHMGPALLLGPILAESSRLAIYETGCSAHSANCVACSAPGVKFYRP